MSDIVLETQGLIKYFDDPVRFKVLNDINMQVKHGEFVSIVGKSGCGKSTLLYILSTMDTDYEGKLFIDGNELVKQGEKILAHIRNTYIGFVFQFHYLITEYSVIDNVMLPGVKLGKLSRKELYDKAMHHLQTLDMQDHALKMPNQLSGGQKQRVAIARALINDPLIIMGDEPTGNLDHKNSRIVFDIFQKICEENKQTILVVTHDPDFAANTSRTITMDDGRIVQ